MGLAAVRSIDAPRRLRTATELEDYEQELVDQYALASAGAGITDRQVAKERYVLFEFIRFLARPVWTCQPKDADRYLVHLRKDRSLAPATVTGKAWVLAQFYDFLLARYQGDIHALTGRVLVQPIDEFNRPPKPYTATVRVPPSDDEVQTLFTGWREALPQARKYLPAARDYLAASLWRRAGLRITETVMLDIRDWRPDLGELGKLHVRFGKGSHGRGPKSRMVPGINSVGDLLQWWLADVRHQYGDDWADPHAPLLPSERRDPLTGRCDRIGANALRTGLAAAVDRWLPAWQGRLTPHGLRHYCASSLYANCWLDYRDTCWPDTLNDHFFLHYRTACRPDAAVGQRWVWLIMGKGLSGTAIREDRILNEAHATDGDVRCLVDLFGLSVQASTRYTKTIDHPDLARLHSGAADGTP